MLYYRSADRRQPLSAKTPPEIKIPTALITVLSIACYTGIKQMCKFDRTYIRKLFFILVLIKGSRIEPSVTIGNIKTRFNNNYILGIFLRRVK